MKLGIILTGDYSWAGGVYYSLNIIKLLQELSLTKELRIVVLVNKHTEQDLLDQLRLKNVEIVSLDDRSVFYKAWCRLAGWITGTNFRFVSDINRLKLDLLYPVIQYEKGHKNLNCKVYYWIYDFQHKFLPELFTQEELAKRDHNFEEIAAKARDVVVSSHDSKKHLLQFYPECKARIHVYNFVSLTEKLPQKPALKVPENYLVVCNQFWPHKNHLTVLKAIELVRSANKAVHVVFTGKYDDVRNKNYVKELQDFISAKNLEPMITFTGFIAREEQLALMAGAKAVIQPSRFEGWSTVIEDAKALNKFLIVSDLPIHREQIANEVLFFKTDDAQTLSEYISTIIAEKLKVTTADYSLNIEKSKKDLLEILVS